MEPDESDSDEDILNDIELAKMVQSHTVRGNIDEDDFPALQGKHISSKSLFQL